jgi:recombination protein RecA
LSADTTSLESALDKDSIRAQALKAFLKDAAKKYPGEVLLASDNNAVLNVEVIPTGVISLDVALGVGGIPKGRITEIYGAEGSGKTSLVLSIAAQAQKLGGYVGFIDTENALDPQRARTLGVDLDKLVIYQPSTAEEAYDMCWRMADSAAFDLLIIDSIAGMAPSKESEEDIGDQQMGLMPRLTAKFIRSVAPKVRKNNVALICINQLREKIGVMYGDPKTTPGGRALKHGASVRIEITTTESESSKIKDSKGNLIGQTCKANIKKNKVSAPYQRTEYDLIYATGFAQERSLMEVAESLGVITKPSPGSPTYIDAETQAVIGRGRENVINALIANPELTSRLLKNVHQALEIRRLSLGEPLEDTEDSYLNDQELRELAQLEESAAEKLDHDKTYPSAEIPDPLG